MRGGSSSKIVPAAEEDLFWPRSGKQKLCPGVRPPLGPSLFLSEVLEETLLAKGGRWVEAFSPKAGNQPLPPQQVEMGRRSPGGQYHRAAEGEVV